MQKKDVEKMGLPDSPGIYFFQKGREVLYIGRATSIRDRARSYFSPDLINSRGKLIAEMAGRADNIKFQKTDSVLEAVILEANLIKKYQPFYNTGAKDDKSFNYVVITKENFPQILVVREKNLNLSFSFPQATSCELQAKFGPFPNGGALLEALKFIRRIFPYRDSKCSPCSLPCESAGCKPCFNRHIGLCPGTCAGEISKKDYAKTVRYIIQIFEGRMKPVIYGLEKEMKNLAKAKNFEKAAVVRDKIFALTHIRDVAFIKNDVNLNAKRWTPNAFPRIEAYDVSHLGGKNARGVAAVLEGGEFVKKEYRAFIIRNSKEGDDVGALREILKRRFKHHEWRFPDVAVVDGGKGQLNAALKIIKKCSAKTKVVSVVKDGRHKARAILNIDKATELFENEILKINAEAHRFAIVSFRKSVCKNWLV